MPTEPSWSNTSKEAKKSRCLRAPVEGHVEAADADLRVVTDTGSSWTTMVDHWDEDQVIDWSRDGV